MVKDFQVYESEGDLEALVTWLNESGRREGPLRAALPLAFPYLRSKTSSAVIERAAGATGGKRSERTNRSVEIAGVAIDDGVENFAAEQVGEEGETSEYWAKGKGKGKAQRRSGETIGHGTIKEDYGRKGCNGDAGGSCDGGTRANGGEARPGSPASPASAAAGGGAGGGGSGRGYGDGKAVLAGPSRNRELRQLLEKGLVELELVLDPSESSNTVVAPASEVVVEFDNDRKVQEDDDASSGGAAVMTWILSKSDGGASAACTINLAAEHHGAKSEDGVSGRGGPAMTWTRARRIRAKHHASLQSHRLEHSGSNTLSPK